MCGGEEGRRKAGGGEGGGNGMGGDVPATETQACGVESEQLSHLSSENTCESSL